MTDMPTLPDGPSLLSMVAPYDQATPGGPIFGGWMMAQCDHVAALAARLEVGSCIIRSFKDLTFHAALSAGETFSFYTQRAHTGRTSVSYTIQAWAEAATEPRLILTATAVLVAIDEAGKPRPIAG